LSKRYFQLHGNLNKLYALTDSWNMGNHIWSGKTWHFSHLTRRMDGKHL